MRNRAIIILCIISAVIFGGCGAIKYVPTDTQIIYSYRDSTIYHRDTVEVEIPREVVKEVVYADSSYLETSVAESVALVDSLGYLHHTLANKPAALNKEILWKERIVYRDSLVTKEVPVEVEVPVKYVPAFYKWCLGFSIVVLLYFLIKFLK